MDGQVRDAKRLAWRTPTIIILAGCLIGLITFGPRSIMGLFLGPMTIENNWSRETFALAIAVQNLLWGLGQPMAGVIADRFGTAKVVAFGALAYAGGLALMAYSDTPILLNMSAGLLIGFGLSGSAMFLVLSSFAKLLPASQRSLAFGLGTAAGSMGQFVFAPLGVAFIDAYGWQTTLLIMAAIILVVPLLAGVLRSDPAEEAAQPGGSQSVMEALSEAFQHKSYNLLVIGFFVCGFHVAFITTHLPPFLADEGIDPAWGGWAIAIIGLFNVFGAFTSGVLSGRMPKPQLLVYIYSARSVVILLFLLAPVSPFSVILFSAAIGLLWLSTVPPTSALVAVMFGTRYMATLYGFVFFSHQVGAFLGVWLGGRLFDTFGSYDVVWWLSVALGVFAALIHWPIKDAPVRRLAAQSA
ncbi:MAG: MFS transporter [Hyphomicrobiales bacterium]|nr:MFS transporter [Hyphomicrobiales bacterium]